MKKAVTIAREAAFDILSALYRAIELAKHYGWAVEQIRFEDAYKALRDAIFPTLPES